MAKQIKVQLWSNLLMGEEPAWEYGIECLCNTLKDIKACPGSAFEVTPPDEDEPCVWCKQGQCVELSVHMAALSKLAECVEKTIKDFQE